MDLKIDELSVLLNISEAVIFRWLEEKTIPHYFIQNEYRFNREEIESWIFQNHRYLGKNFKKEEDCELKQDSCFSYSFYKAFYRGDILFLNVDSKEEVIQITAAFIAEKINSDPQVISELLIQREKILSTGIGEGIAIPHAKDFLLSTHYDVVVIVILEKPIEYSSFDQKPVDMLFFLFACGDESHLNIINKIVKFGLFKETKPFFLQLPNKDKALKFVKTWEDRFLINSQCKC